MPEQIVGVLDTTRVLTESTRALGYQRQLDEREKAIAAELQRLAKQLSKAELEVRRQRYLSELKQLRARLEEQLNQEIRTVVERIAQERKLVNVLTRSPVLYGDPRHVLDITDEVISQLSTSPQAYCRSHAERTYQALQELKTLQWSYLQNYGKFARDMGTLSFTPPAGLPFSFSIPRATASSVVMVASCPREASPQLVITLTLRADGTSSLTAQGR